MSRKGMTLARHVLEQQRYSPEATGELSSLLIQLGLAGGRASTGTESILALQPKNLHQRVPLFIGSAEEVARAESFIQGRRRKGIADSGAERLP